MPLETRKGRSQGLVDETVCAMEDNTVFLGKGKQFRMAGTESSGMGTSWQGKRLLEPK